jgi:transcription elongation factor Elf1
MEIKNIEEAKLQLDSLVRTNKEKYVFKCEKCGKESSVSWFSLKTQIEKNHLYCRSCSQKEAMINHYGVSNTFQLESVKTTIKSKHSQIYNEDREIKKRKTCLEKYGVDVSSKAEGVKAKQEKTMIERYGFKSALQNKDIKLKSSKTCKKNFNVDWPQQSKEVREKTMKSCLSIWGVPTIFENKDIQDKQKKTMFSRYGVEYPNQFPEFYKKAIGIKGKSKPEKKFEEMLKNRNFEYEAEYKLGNHFFDFVVFKNNEPKVAIDIDGLYYHSLLSDPDGKHVTEGYDVERFLYCNNINMLIIDENKLEEGFISLLNMFGISYQEFIKNIFNFCKNNSFPYISFEEDRLVKDYKNLCNRYEYTYGQDLGKSSILHFHKSIWDCTVRNHPSPLKAWTDKDLLLKCIKNRFIYQSNLSSQNILNGFTICNIAPRISLFSASYARYLINKYLAEYNTVFDPFCGFSGRLLGCCSLGKMYIGQDINPKTIEESLKIKDFHKLNATLTTKNILESTGSFDCLFSCPPYNLKEQWGMVLENKSCDEWIDICLQNFKCKSYLFVVDKTEKYKKYIQETKEIKSHIIKSSEQVIFIK